VRPPVSATTDPFKGRLMFTAEETANLLGVNTKSSRSLGTKGRLKSSNALRVLRIPKTEIERAPEIIDRIFSGSSKLEETHPCHSAHPISLGWQGSQIQTNNMTDII
jgi:hypothetical protein